MHGHNRKSKSDAHTKERVCQGERDLDLSLDCLARPFTFSFRSFSITAPSIRLNLNDINPFCFPSSLSKFMELDEPWLDSSWHLEVTTEEVKEGLKKTVSEGEVGEMEETVREIEDVCLGEVFLLKDDCHLPLPS